MIEYIDGKACLTEEKTRIWCVYDRDKEETPAKLSKGNISFDESIKTANSNGIKVAWSNDAFELWILLHFEEIDVLSGSSFKVVSISPRKICGPRFGFISM